MRVIFPLIDVIHRVKKNSVREGRIFLAVRPRWMNTTWSNNRIRERFAPENLVLVHKKSSISLNSRKYLKPPINIVITDMEQLEEDLFYPEYPLRILGQKYRVTRNQSITFYKVQWSNHTEDEATWKQEEFLKSNCP